MSVTIISTLPIVGPCAMGTPITTGGGSRDREIPRFRSPVRTIVGRARYIVRAVAAAIVSYSSIEYRTVPSDRTIDDIACGFMFIAFRIGPT